jgi:putative ABC transport system ATP-binding protein
LDLTSRIIHEHALTTLMVTHNMRQALRLGNRLIMLHRGKVILDIQGPDKQALSQEDLVSRFYDAQTDGDMTDRMLLG